MRRADVPSSTQNKTVPVAIAYEFVDGDIYRWGAHREPVAHG